MKKILKIVGYSAVFWGILMRRFEDLHKKTRKFDEEEKPFVQPCKSYGRKLRLLDENY